VNEKKQQVNLTNRGRTMYVWEKKQIQCIKHYYFLHATGTWYIQTATPVCWIRLGDYMFIFVTILTLSVVTSFW
jgi:hypothetical protein